MAVTVPSFLPEPFANEGQYAIIPDKPSSEQGRASWQQGFPQVCAQPLASGGIPPNYLDFQGIFNALSSSICYMQTGALWPWSSTLTYPLGAHVLGSDNNEYVAVQENTGQDPTQDATNVYWLRADAGDGVPVGTIVWSAATTAPNGYLLCNGATVGRSTYAALFAAIGTTYGAGDGSTTFALPNLIGRVMWGGTSPGAYLEAGLPNIKGAFWNLASYKFGGTASMGSASGVFSTPSQSSSDGVIQVSPSAYTSQTTYGDGINLDAGRASSVYSDSVDTVQPPALTLVPYIKAFSAATNQGMIDMTSLANDIAALDAERLKQIGQIQTFVSTNLPEGWMICDGSSVLFADWPEFEQVYNEGRFTGMTLSASDPAQKGKLVLNGSSGVYLPDLEGLYEQASTTATAGGYLAPGLPNIKGSGNVLIAYSNANMSGALKETWRNMNSQLGAAGSTMGGYSFTFNAASYNSTYSDSIDTVQPPSVRYVRAMYLGKPAAA